MNSKTISKIDSSMYHENNSKIDSKTVFFKSTVFFLMLFFAFSCSDDSTTETTPLGDYENGYFITNEGPFQNGTGTITFVGDDGVVSQNVYKTVNGEDLGNIVNSMYIYDDTGYIVVNNSHRVVVVNRYTMEKLATIEGSDILNPRHFTVANDTGYVSNWGDPFDTTDDYVAVVDLNTNTVISKISVGEGPERMISNESEVFVALQGGYGQNNMVVLIDTATGQIKDNITVGDVPNSLAFDDAGDVLVLCGGAPAFTGSETAGSLYTIDTSDFSTSFLEFQSKQHPNLLNYDGGLAFYLLGGKVYQTDSSSESLPTEAVNGLDGFYYGMTVKNRILYGTDAGDFASEGTVKRYNVISGDLLETIPAGVVPGSVVVP